MKIRRFTNRAADGLSGNGPLKDRGCGGGMVFLALFGLENGAWWIVQIFYDWRHDLSFQQGISHPLLVNP
jgi:hypothetical protein